MWLNERNNPTNSWLKRGWGSWLGWMKEKKYYPTDSCLKRGWGVQWGCDVVLCCYPLPTTLNFCCCCPLIAVAPRCCHGCCHVVSSRATVVCLCHTVRCDTNRQQLLLCKCSLSHRHSFLVSCYIPLHRSSIYYNLCLISRWKNQLQPI